MVPAAIQSWVAVEIDHINKKFSADWALETSWMPATVCSSTRGEDRHVATNHRLWTLLHARRGLEWLETITYKRAYKLLNPLHDRRQFDLPVRAAVGLYHGQELLSSSVLKRGAVLSSHLLKVMSSSEPHCRAEAADAAVAWCGTSPRLNSHKAPYPLATKKSTSEPVCHQGRGNIN